MSFSSLRLSFYIPDFVEIQRQSFLNLLDTGLIKELNKRNPITNTTQNLELIFYPEYYKLNPPEWTPKEAILKSKTYACRLYVPIKLTNTLTKEVKIQWILLGDLPLMTKRGHFIVNGSPRVIVNQIVRSPGIYYKEVIKNKKRTYRADLIPHRGAWLQLEIDKKRRIWAKMKKTPKISILAFLQALGLSKEKIFQSIHYSHFLNDSFLNEEKEEQGHPISSKEALLTLYLKTQSKKGKIEITPDLGQKWLFGKLFNLRTYDLSQSGRVQINKKLGLAIPLNTSTLTEQDILFAIDYLIKLEYGLGTLDDIDDLKNRRVRASGELIQNQLGTGFIRLEKEVRDKMKKPKKKLTVGNLITTKPVNEALRQFFGSSQLSQFMDQINPLSELAHKRRLSSLGPGGITTKKPGMEVRGIHPSHYGRICPIETPEGQNAGLVNSLTTYARINPYGFIETPFYNVFQGQIQKSGGPIFFSAAQEQNIILAPGDLKLSQLEFLPKNAIPARTTQEFKKVFRDEVEYISISPIQMISIATSLIPFLEHNDANRALMGSNMQRQAVPLIAPERPIVGTGLEGRVAVDSGHGVQSKTNGFVFYATGEKIIIKNFRKLDKTFQNFTTYSRCPTGLANKVSLGKQFGLLPYLTQSYIKDSSSCLLNFREQVFAAHSTKKNQNRHGKFDQLTKADILNVSSTRKNLVSEGFFFRNKLGVAWDSGLSGLKANAFKLRDLKSNQIFVDYHKKQVREKSVSKKQKTNVIFKKTSFQGAQELRASAFRKSKSYYHNRFTSLQFQEKNKLSRWDILTQFKFDEISAWNEFQNKTSKDYFLNSHSAALSMIKQKSNNFTIFKNGKEFLPFRQSSFSLLSANEQKKGNKKIEVYKPYLESVNYMLQEYQRSNQDTCLAQRPIVHEGDWVQKGDLLADGTASVGGELALGKTILVAYMPWEGYNFEDAILISERLIYDDIYTSIHITEYSIETRDTKLGVEQITSQIPGISPSQIYHLDTRGIAKIGSWVKEGDILVGKITPQEKKPLSPHEKLMNAIFQKEIPTTKDTSLRVPKNVHGRVIHIQVLETKSIAPEIHFQGPRRVVIYVAEKRKIQIGDKMAGRHGNKGIISQILPRQDMPYLPDGTPVDMVLNPLGVPSRMNVGQVFECLLGLAGKKLNQQFKIVHFDEVYGPEASRSLVYSKLFEARIKTRQKWLFDPNFAGKAKIFDGRTGDSFYQAVTVGQAYMLKLVHMVDEKIHARSTGPYALVTQQPIRGRSNRGGQRLGEMEVWALEGFGAAYTLQELLTVKADDKKGREQVMDAILHNRPISFGTPESVKLLIRELQSLCLDVGVYTVESSGQRKQINIMKLS
jgi:DNA-directed RNA polymerase subunit beta